MVTPLTSASRSASTDNLLGPTIDDTPTPTMPRPLITMGDSADSGDGVTTPLNPAGASATLGPHRAPRGGTGTGSGTAGGSEGGPQEQGATRSVPDIELHARESRPEFRGYRHLAPQTRCSCSHLPRATSRESIRSVQGGAINEVVVVAPTSYRDRIIRQHSQPETCLHCHHPKPSASLRYLPRYEHSPGEGISTIVTDSLRINGALRHFKQVSKVTPLDYHHHNMLDNQPGRCETRSVDRQKTQNWYHQRCNR
ncbi:uncharacterized protein LOC143026775 [Oratosquilla oratoria]|uniref:uncharacterized protein LOC143026775 n=1 Tax=Oratosquilla oratoria TaxID=337810 RepID=UPI003F76D461